jgi:hypothetical protein
MLARKALSAIMQVLLALGLRKHAAHELKAAGATFRRKSIPPIVQLGLTVPTCHHNLLVRHRQTKGAETDMFGPKVTAPHLDSTQSGCADHDQGRSDSAEISPWPVSLSV